MATAFVNNSDYTPIANDAVTAIRAARKGVVKAALVALTVVVCVVTVAAILVEYSRIADWSKPLVALVVVGYVILAAANINHALDQLWCLPEYQALQRERARLRFFLGRLTAVCHPGVALEWRGANRAYKVWRARTASGAPAGLRVLALNGTEIKRYQVCRFGAEFIVCQVYEFKSSVEAETAFRRGIIDGHSVAEVFGEDDPHVLRQLNTVLERVTSQEAIQTPPPNGGEFPTHTV